jgi:hypothetical protein
MQDLVVSGHTHAACNCRLPNAAGREIPVTSAGSGRFKPPAAAYRVEDPQRSRRIGGSVCPTGADTNP